MKIASIIFTAMLAACVCAKAQGIYTCVDAKGKKRTSDRPIPECSDREQRVLNKDGTLKRVELPALTPNERAEQEAAKRKEAEERACAADGRSTRQDNSAGGASAPVVRQPSVTCAIKASSPG
jgi:Domain of unknown function (DUF4124)